MKFLHLADLHLGKKIGEYSLIDCQKDALDKALNLVIKENISTIVLSGDIYDSHDPSIEAMKLLNYFLNNCYKNNIKLLMISGNHDQSSKLHYASEILKNNNIFIVTETKDSLKPIKIDGVNFYLLPYFNKFDYMHSFNETISNMDEALKSIIKKMNLDKTVKNVLITHLAVAKSKEEKIYASGSETSLNLNVDGSIGGEDLVSSYVLNQFNYVALGHIHKAYNVSNNIRYPGALLKYHKDEANNKKTFTVVDTDTFEYKEYPYNQLHDVVVLEGLFDELKKEINYVNDYVFFNLTDKEYISEPMASLKQIFPYAVNINYKSVKSNVTYTSNYENIEKVSKLELFNDFYKMQKENEMTDKQRDEIRSIIKEVWGE